MFSAEESLSEWIGAGAIIFPRVTVGEFAIVGAGAVVNRDVQRNSVSYGVQSRHH
jgi:acetyltransferase-like isoleucine patch superfamily enzyme